MSVVAPVYFLRAGTEVLTTWVDRKGDYLIATAELVSALSADLEVRVYTRDIDASGDGEVVGPSTLISLSSPGRQALEWGPFTGVGLRQLVRYRLTIVNHDPPDANAFIICRMLSPVWFDAVRVPN